MPASIKSNILGIMLIKNLKNIEFMFKTKTNEYEEIENIINRHLKSDRDILECQEELIDKGFKQYAKL